VITENLEGVGALCGPNGEILLWLIADDNFNPLQRPSCCISPSPTDATKKAARRRPFQIRLEPA
jgi:hypothetical protein